MRESFLATTAENRSHILALAIRTAGFTCSSGKSATAAGPSNAMWRVHCGGNDVYWVEVDEFDRLSVEPIPYGDFAIWLPRTVFPSEQGERTIEIIPLE